MKFENINLDKFKQNELKDVQANKVRGGISTYVVSASREGDGTITDSKIEHDSGSGW